MGRPVDSGDILEVAFVQNQANQRLLNLFHYQLSATVGFGADGDAVVDIVRNALLAGATPVPAFLRPQMTVEWELLYTRFQWISATRYTPIEVATGAGTGTRVGQAAPQNVATTVTKRGIRSGRTYRGSSHWGGMVALQVNNGLVSQDRIDAMVDAHNVLSQVIDVSAVPNAGVMTPVIYHRAAPAASQRWESFLVQQTSRVMRRRTVGVGV